MVNRLFLLCLAGVITLASAAFVPNGSKQHHHVAYHGAAQHQHRTTTTTTTTTSSLHVVTDAVSMETARTAFYIWFFGASGGIGIALGAFPRMYDNVRIIQSLNKNEGRASLGGEQVPLSFLCGYPVKGLSLADINQICRNVNVGQIVADYPVEGNFLSDQGYLTYTAFADANEQSNPLTVRAIFDTLGSSVDVCNPNEAQDKLDAYAQDPSLVASELLNKKLVGFSSIFVLLFLLGLANVAAFGHAHDGWFPEWPGLDNMPASLFDSETGLGAIPKYWQSDSGK